jgi:hypothetical protein
MTYRHTADREGDDSLTMAMYHTVHIRVGLVKLAVDESLGITLRCLFVHRTGIINIVLLDVFSTCNEGWSKRTRDEECRRVLRIAYADVPVCVENFLVVEDVVGSD